MKRFFSFLCALTIILSANAAPQLKTAKALNEKHGFELSKKTIAEKGHAVAKKARSQKAATEITIVDCSGEFYSSYGEFVYALVDEDGIEYYFAFPSSGEDIESGKTYTLADMEAEDTYWINWEEFEYAGFTAVTFIKTEDGKGGVKIVVTATDENGTDFVLTYEFIVTGEVVVIDVPESVSKPEYYEEEEGEDGDWYFVGHNADYEFAVDIYGEKASMIGEYTFADFYAYYTYVYDPKNKNEIAAKDATASVTAGENDTLNIHVEILGNDGVKYVINAFYAAPSALAKETINAENLEIVKSDFAYGWNTYDRYDFSASDEKNAIEFAWIDWEEAGSYLGTFDVEDLTGFAVTPAGKNYSSVASGSVTIANSDDKIVVTGTVLCYNNVEYTLNLSFEKGPAQEIDITISEGLIYTDAVASQGWWQIRGQNDTYYITLSNGNTITEAAGTYTVADLDADYSFLEVLATEKEIAFVEGSVTLAVNKDVVTVVGALKDIDGNTYKINLTYKDPVPEKTVDVVIPEGSLYEEYADDNLYGFYGSAKNGDYVQLGIWTAVLEGNFTEEDLDMQYVGSGLKIGGEAVNIFTANITIESIGEDLVLKAQLLCYNNTLYNVTMTIPGKAQGIENIELTEKAQKVAVDGVLYIIRDNKMYNVQGARVR